MLTTWRTSRLVLHFYGQGTQRNDRGATVFNIRGMTPTQSFGQVSTVFIDGAAISFGRVEGFTDIERVEVIKGPQSAYFGRAHLCRCYQLRYSPTWK